MGRDIEEEKEEWSSEREGRGRFYSEKIN